MVKLNIVPLSCVWTFPVLFHLCPCPGFPPWARAAACRNRVERREPRAECFRTDRFVLDSD